MNRKDVFRVTDRKSLEDYLDKQISCAKNIELYEISSATSIGRSYGIRVIPDTYTTSMGSCKKDKDSTLYASIYHGVVVYISSYDNPYLFVELDLIHNMYFYSMGTTRGFIPCKDYFVMFFNKEEKIAEDIANYGNPNKGVLAYNGASKGNTCFDMTISSTAKNEDIADAFASYLVANGGTFEETLWKNSIEGQLDEFVLSVKHGDGKSKPNFIRRDVGTKISGPVIELLYGDEIRIYIGSADAQYIMRANGERILDNDREVIQIPLQNNRLIEIYQKNARLTLMATHRDINFHVDFGNL